MGLLKFQICFEVLEILTFFGVNRRCSILLDPSLCMNKKREYPPWGPYQYFNGYLLPLVIFQRESGHPLPTSGSSHTSQGRDCADTCSCKATLGTEIICHMCEECDSASKHKCLKLFRRL